MFHVEFILRGASLVPLVIKGSLVILFIPLCGRRGLVHLSSVRSSVFGYCSMLSLFSVVHPSFGHRRLGEQSIVRSSWFRRSILGLIIGVLVIHLSVGRLCFDDPWFGYLCFDDLFFFWDFPWDCSPLSIHCLIIGVLVIFPVRVHSGFGDVASARSSKVLIPSFGFRRLVIDFEGGSMLSLLSVVQSSFGHRMWFPRSSKQLK